MRIITGIYGGRRLDCPDGQKIRPTSDKVKGALFNILNNRIDWDEAVVLDACCGTGSLGIEALSRGASFATFVDADKESVKFAKQNLAKLKAEQQSDVMLADVCKLGAARRAHNLLFLDPPYSLKLCKKAIEGMIAGGWLTDDALLVIETGAKHPQPMPEAFEIVDEREYGATKILFLEKK